MDKFGIFNILNSLFSLNNQKNPTENANSAPFSLDKFLSSFNNNNSQTPAVNTKPLPEKKVFAPLQSSMLCTMHSHDQFVKRVKEKNKV